MRPMTVLIADDHPLMRKGIRAALEGEPDIARIVEVDDGEAAWEALRREPCDIALVDIEMPRLGGIGLARRIAEAGTGVKVVMLTMHKDEEVFDQAMQAGACGYVLKENAAEDILACLRSVHGGGYYVSPALAGFLVRKERSAKASAVPYLDTLTRTERTVLLHIAAEKTTQQIADTLFISPKTVENHRTNISRKLRLTGAHNLLKFALRYRDLLRD